VLLEQNVPTHSYVTKVALIKGQTYKFKVQARNDVGLSSFSSEVAILVATLPESPIEVQTYFYVDKIEVSWTASYDGGSPIIAYKIEI
jgi:hypothetical protein